LDAARQNQKERDEARAELEHVRSEAARVVAASGKDAIEATTASLNALHAKYARVQKEREEAMAVVERLVDALIWTGGSDDFAPGGKASAGWHRFAGTALDAASALRRARAKDPNPATDAAGSAVHPLTGAQRRCLDILTSQ